MRISPGLVRVRVPQSLASRGGTNYVNSRRKANLIPNLIPRPISEDMLRTLPLFPEESEQLLDEVLRLLLGDPVPAAVDFSTAHILGQGLH